MEPVTLRTERLLLRPWAPGDEEVLVQGCNDDLIVQWTRVPPEYTRDLAVRRIADSERGWAEGRQLSWAVCDTETGKVLAALDLRHLAEDTWDVGFLCYAWARGQGVVPEACRAVARWAFSALGASRVEWRAVVGNERSRRAADKAGFVHEGILRGRHLHHHDTWVASLVPSDVAEEA